ncbi:hypothetical protein GCM10022236_42810 [Microlunatus ginsengisoli]|uniref:Uncharacterized protein n=1 Tax=Microlunatus ginsengisoli TaxID=363863 RepID=A0ABP7AMC4_9ACTN
MSVTYAAIVAARAAIAGSQNSVQHRQTEYRQSERGGGWIRYHNNNSLVKSVHLDWLLPRARHAAEVGAGQLIALYVYARYRGVRRRTLRWATFIDELARAPSWHAGRLFKGSGGDSDQARPGH